MNNELKLTIPEIEQINTFADEMLTRNAQIGEDFGQADLPRTDVDRFADTVLGKAAEVFFMAFARQYNVSTHVDFDIYPDQHVTDRGQDVPFVELSHKGYPGWFDNIIKIDIKATTFRSKWLLVEERKFDSAVYVLVQTDAPPNWEQRGMDLGALSGAVAGFAYWTTLFDQRTQKPWFYFERGDSLFHPDRLQQDAFTDPEELHAFMKENPQRAMNMTLRSDRNFALPVHWLLNDRDEWGSLFNLISEGARP